MVRSLDVQQVLLQSNVVERVQQVQQQHADVQQRYFEDQLTKEKRELKEKVKDIEETERLMINEEERRGKKKTKSEDGRTKKEKECADDDANNLSAGETGGKVDIRV